MKLNNWLKVNTRWSTIYKMFLGLPLLATIFLLSYEQKAVSALDIKVGIVQRFGDELEDEIIFKSNQGDSLSVKFNDHKTQKNPCPHSHRN